MCKYLPPILLQTSRQIMRIACKIKTNIFLKKKQMQFFLVARSLSSRLNIIFFDGIKKQKCKRLQSTNVEDLR